MRIRFSRSTGALSLFLLVGSGLVLLMYVGPFSYNLAPSARDQKRTANAEKMSQVATYLGGFKYLCGQYPTTAEGLAVLAKKLPKSKCDTPNPAPITDKIPLDEWGQPFTYESDGTHFVLESLGDSKGNPRGLRYRLEAGWRWPKIIDWQGIHDW
jgi:hypothetical protein